MNSLKLEAVIQYNRRNEYFLLSKYDFHKGIYTDLDVYLRHDIDRLIGDSKSGKVIRGITKKKDSIIVDKQVPRYKMPTITLTYKFIDKGKITSDKVLPILNSYITDSYMRYADASSYQDYSDLEYILETVYSKDEIKEQGQYLLEQTAHISGYVNKKEITGVTPYSLEDDSYSIVNSKMLLEWYYKKRDRINNIKGIYGIALSYSENPIVIEYHKTLQEYEKLTKNEFLYLKLTKNNIAVDTETILEYKNLVNRKKELGNEIQGISNEIKKEKPNIVICLLQIEMRG